MRALQIAAMTAFISAASVGFAQTSSTDPAAPSRATSSATEAQTQSPSDTSPSAASSPHQRQATSDGAAGKDTMGKETMKECVAKQKASNSGMSAADARKACKQEMKTNSGH